MADEIPDYDDGPRTPEVLEKLEKQEFQPLVPSLDEDGKFFVGADDLANWLSENQDMRPPGSGPDGEWTVGDEEAAMANFEDGMDFGGREPYDVLADKLHDQGYDFSPEGAESRKLQKIIDHLPDSEPMLEAMRRNLIEEFGTDGFVRDGEFFYGRSLPEATDEERAFSLEQARQTMEELKAKAEESKLKPSSRPYPNEMSRTITHPDGFVEFDEEVFPDPERDKIMGDTFRALREAAAKRTMAKQKEAERRGRQDPASTLGPSFKAD